MATERKTVQNLQIHAIDTRKGLLLIRARSPVRRDLWCSSHRSEGGIGMTSVDVHKPGGGTDGTVDLPPRSLTYKVASH